MRYRVVAVRHRGDRWQSKWKFSLEKCLEQAARWREQYPDLLALGIEDETGKEHPIPTTPADHSD